MATSAIVAATVVSESKNYMSDLVATEFFKRIPNKIETAKAIKIRYFLKALESPDLSTSTKDKIYQGLINLVPIYNLDSISILT